MGNGAQVTGAGMHDPLTDAISPPHDETVEQKADRHLDEANAKRISDEIDRLIEADAVELKRRRRKGIKVLLLGQSESGKSTTLKNFQLQCAPKKWAEERASWRAVIQLNLARSVNIILDALPPDSTHKTSLAPLLKVQKDLERRIGANSREDHLHGHDDDSDDEKRPAQEPFVRSYEGWKAAMSKFFPRASSDTEEDGVTKTLVDCREHMQALCEDVQVRRMIRDKAFRLEDSAEFFLSNIERVASPNYVPSDDDVIRSRLRTVGVQEHRIVFETSRYFDKELLVYDVGGARSCRAVWPAYFDDVNAIIFLAPVNCFDERLAEDRRVNRLEDSFNLWQTVCKNKLLAKTMLILFLNKCDLLDKKLKSGVKIKDSMPSYGGRPNDARKFTRYLRRKFVELSMQDSPEPRKIFLHLTTLTDTESTAITLSEVQDGILKNQLLHANML
ncbi:G-alpha-domain-containing protein [Rickenella mellea]|uniref:G-alpha-domain-containing protein n=1 Tax=Rickenella mellea TaxID=50990 RepID=A0A4Y7PTS9_9AGAM|nr:G-alpha-domain-containing protein [Rickenella mellea]